MPAIFISEQEALEIIEALEYAVADAEADEGLFKSSTPQYKSAIKRMYKFTWLLGVIKARVAK